MKLNKFTLLPYSEFHNEGPELGFRNPYHSRFLSRITSVSPDKTHKSTTTEF